MESTQYSLVLGGGPIDAGNGGVGVHSFVVWSAGKGVGGTGVGGAGRIHHLDGRRHVGGISSQTSRYRNREAFAALGARGNGGGGSLLKRIEQFPGSRRAIRVVVVVALVWLWAHRQSAIPVAWLAHWHG